MITCLGHVEVFFATKSSTIPVRAEIRNMINANYAEEFLPFSVKYLNPDDANVSTDLQTGALNLYSLHQFIYTKILSIV